MDSACLDAAIASLSRSGCQLKRILMSIVIFFFLDSLKAGKRGEGEVVSVVPEGTNVSHFHKVIPRIIANCSSTVLNYISPYIIRKVSYAPSLIS